MPAPTFTDGQAVNAAIMNALVAYITGSQSQGGTSTITPSAANTPTSLVVTFPTPFASTPTNAQVTPVSAAPGTAVTGVGYTALTATSITLWVTRVNTTTTTLSWTVFP